MLTFSTESSVGLFYAVLSEYMVICRNMGTSFWKFYPNSGLYFWRELLELLSTVNQWWPLVYRADRPVHLQCNGSEECIDDDAQICRARLKLMHSVLFLARDVIYTSRAYVTMSVSVCLSICL